MWFTVKTIIIWPKTALNILRGDRRRLYWFFFIYLVIDLVIDLITALGKDRITAVLHVSRVKNITRNLKGSRS
jgi:hypothetical protein